MMMKTERSSKPNHLSSHAYAALVCLFVMQLANSAVAAGPVGGTAQQRMDAIAKAVPTAVLVFEPGGSGGGSGVLISPTGEALTNFHVTSPAGSFMRCGLSNGKIYDAVLIGLDPVGDLALIKLISDEPFPYAKLADSNLVRVGDPCFAAGNPFLLATNLEPSVSWGIVSGTHRYQFPSGTLLEYADCLQTDAAINPGNSGGALFNANADVIGIVGRCSFEKRGRINVGIGYAISSNQAQNFLGVLRSGRIVDHATLGATVSAGEGGRARISNILDQSDVYRRGLRYGDELLSVDGREIRTPNDLTNILGTLPEGWRVPVVYRRDDVKFETIVRLPGVHAEGELVKKMEGALPGDEPKPKSKPKSKPKDGQAPEEPAPETPDPHESKEKSPWSESLLALHEERAGLANEYFNRQARERMVAGIQKTLPAGLAANSGWVIRGNATQPEAMAMQATLQASGGHLTVGSEFDSKAPMSELYEAINERTLAGLQATLMLWEQLARSGTAGIGEATYYGTAPLRGQRPLRDCMMLTIGELAARVYTSADTGRLEAIEIQADPDTDPVEMYVVWDDQDPTRLKSLELVYGTDTTLLVDVTEVRAITSEPGAAQGAVQ